MKKSFGKKNRRRGKNPGKQQKKSHNSTALVLLDQTPFLKKALSKCKRLRNELNKKQTLLSKYEDNDLTVFQQWLNRTFGAKFTRLQELEETLAQYDFILFNLSNCSIFCPDKLAEMHKELFERKEKGTLYQFVPPPTIEDQHDEEWEDDDEWEDEIDDEAAEAIFDEIFGSEEDDYEGEDDFRRTYEQHRKSMSASEESKLKKCYRVLAKKLHPDHSTFDESLREKRWHEVQEAYQNNDLEALLRVEAICDLDETDLSVQLGLARLNDLANYHQSHLKPIRRALSHAKQDIAFGFAEGGPTKEIKDEMKYEFESKLQRLEYLLVNMQQSVDDILQEYEEQFDEIPPVVSTPKNQRIYNDPKQMNLF